ncbi:MAG: SGNH/GDSL hydrolase family protein [Pseudonocardia sp.]|nr:SGNH/GDSL hydrolase family protein [Pseudonocardia sp.]
MGIVGTAGRALLVAAAGFGWWVRRRDRLAGLEDDFAAYWRRRSRRPGELRYLALGDSLAQGLTARRPERGFVGLLADELAAATGRTVAVLNLSVTGATVADVVAEQLPVLVRQAGAAPDLVTVCVGTNDVTRTDPERFRADFRALCAGLPAGALVADIPHVPRGPHRAAAAAYSEICREVLAEFPTLVAVPIERATTGFRPWELGADLAHPGDPGHRRYAAAFRERVVDVPPAGDPLL